MKPPRFENLPHRISRLSELAYNLWWSWDPPARSLFRTLDLGAWRGTRHNPVRMLREIPDDVLHRKADDAEFLLAYDRVMASFDRYMKGEDTWFSRNHPDRGDLQIAYFCAEFGLHSSLPIYSGGLGVLAGDTCKEASDLGLPLVAIGYYYPEGYFLQNVAPDGRQDAVYIKLKWEDAPILPVSNGDGTRRLVSVPVAEREVGIGVWQVQAGRVPIYLMDTTIESNDPWDRDVAARLYGGDHSVRLRQEIILGMGGLKVLERLGLSPSVLHLNEGHAAFASLELLARFLKEGLDFEAALAQVRRHIVFTTHTPVKAGHDEFSFPMMEEYFGPYCQQLGITREQLLDLGRLPQGDSFVMTALALSTARRCNGVSQIHGCISREMWKDRWPDREVDDVPIESITNGVHVPTWVAPEMAAVFEKYLGEAWLDRHDDPALWEKVYAIPDEELWQAHALLKRRLWRLVRERARLRWLEGTSSHQIVALGGLLDPDTLTIGFARRFATYKRGSLILSDRERLRKLLLHPRRPVQLIFAGKAHPADEPGQYVLQEVFRACMSQDLGGRIAFIEEYDTHVAQLLVHGVDVWLNNPIPPLEASGTSGQKASLNGVPNCSVLDGWWYEGYDGRNGWAIDEETGKDDEKTARALYKLLEDSIAPLFYRRDENGVPLGWIRLMKDTIRSLAAPFSARRMMKDYFRNLYLAPQEEAEPTLKD